MAIARSRTEHILVEVTRMLAVGLAIQTLKIRRGLGSVAVYWAKTTSRIGLFGCSIQRPQTILKCQSCFLSRICFLGS